MTRTACVDRYRPSLLLAAVGVFILSGCMQRNPARLTDDTLFSAPGSRSDMWPDDFPWGNPGGTNPPPLNIGDNSDSPTHQSLTFQWAVQQSLPAVVMGSGRVPAACTGPLVTQLPEGDATGVSQFEVRLQNQIVNTWAYTVDPATRTLRLDRLFCHYPDAPIVVRFLYQDSQTGGGSSPWQPNPGLVPATIVNLGLGGCGPMLYLQNGEVFQPVNLPTEFNRVGMRVAVALEPLPDGVSTCMAGPMVRILAIMFLSY